MFEGLPRLQPMTPQPQDWEKPGQRQWRTDSPRPDHTVLDSLPVLFHVNGKVRTLDTSDDVANREDRPGRAGEVSRATCQTSPGRG